MILWGALGFVKKEKTFSYKNEMVDSKPLW